MRLIGLDLGSKSMGIAITDSQQTIVSGLENFWYQKQNLHICLNKIKQLLVYYTNDVQAIILGYPTDVNGKKNSQTLLVEQFYNLLVQNISCKVIYHDERYSTKQATYDLKFNLGLKSSQIKKIKDKMSAVVILEDYLSSLKWSKL